MNINIQDSLQQLKEAVEELEALRTVIAMAEDHPVYSWNSKLKNNRRILVFLKYRKAKA